jgi:hypothetical protein
MKIVTLIARLLLGLMFVVFGSNGFLHFIPMGEMPAGLAGGFMAALAGTPYFYFVAAIMVVAGLLLLVNRFVPLALTLLGPVLVNILLYHFLLHPEGFLPAIVATALWLVVFFAHISAFAGIFRSRS